MGSWLQVDKAIRIMCAFQCAEQNSPETVFDETIKNKNEVRVVS